LLPGDEVSRDLGLVMAIGNQIFLLGMPSLAPISMIGFLFAARAISISDLYSAMMCCFLFPTWPHPPCSLGDE
jgi:hypothetical protein